MIFILLVMILDLILPFVIAIPYMNYSHVESVMSILGCKNSPLGFIYNLWMIFSGFVVMILGYILFITYKNLNYSLATLIFILFILYGLGDEIISGIFSLNEKKDHITISSIIHSIGSTLGFTALQIASIVLTILQFKSNEVFLAIISTLCFLLSLICLLFFVLGKNSKFKNSLFSLEGLWQRLSFTLMYVPFILWIIMRL